MEIYLRGAGLKDEMVEIQAWWTVDELEHACKEIFGLENLQLTLDGETITGDLQRLSLVAGDTIEVLPTEGQKSTSRIIEKFGSLQAVTQQLIEEVVANDDHDTLTHLMSAGLMTKETIEKSTQQCLSRTAGGKECLRILLTAGGVGTYTNTSDTATHVIISECVPVDILWFSSFLTNCVGYGSLHALRTVVARDPSVVTAILNYRTWLFWHAANCCHLNVLRYFLEELSPDRGSGDELLRNDALIDMVHFTVLQYLVDRCQDMDRKFSVLCGACRKGELDIVKHLVETCKVPLCIDLCRYSALDTAVSCEMIPCVVYLVEIARKTGILQDLLIHNKVSLLTTAVIAPLPQYTGGALQYLLRNVDIDLNEGSPLCHAAGVGNEHACKVLLKAFEERKVTPLDSIVEGGIRGGGSFVQCCAIYNLNVVDAMEQARMVPIMNMVTMNGETPLFLAARVGSVEWCRWLVRHAPRTINVCDEDGQSPLLMACCNGSSHLVKTLLSSGADPMLHSKHNDWPIYWACRTGLHEVIRCLYKNMSDAPNLDGFLVAASRKGHFRTVTTLLEMGAEATWIALYWAKRNGHRDTAVKLESVLANREQGSK
eukprot:TRINITY_DN6033_c0_g2_i8.p1 TRINITY_DN6033_c0_g2~~TRINITY_DN6033_c0_g2_i8.p1  ORF type:complete len:600 (+),score=76.33 TRINITY_DN6033_c0_g2_i8:43-1842(+)